MFSNLGDFLDYINFVSDKTISGDTMSPQEFNTVLPVAQQEYLNEEYRSYEKTQTETDTIRSLKVHLGGNLPPLSIDSDGFADIPSGYWHNSSMYYKYANITSSGLEVNEVPVNILTDGQFSARIGSMLTPPTTKYPVATFRDTKIEFRPKTLGRVFFTYLKFPTKPVYDYYIDVYGDHIYLPEGTTHTLAVGEQGSAGQTSGTVSSNSYELTLPVSTHIKIANLVLSKIGINLREKQLFEYAEISKRQKGNE